MSDDTHRNLDPYDSRIEKLAKAVFGLMEEKYEEAPIPEDNWTMARELEMNVPEDIEQVYAYGLWLFTALLSYDACIRPKPASHPL